MNREQNPSDVIEAAVYLFDWATDKKATGIYAGTKAWAATVAREVLGDPDERVGKLELALQDAIKLAHELRSFTHDWDWKYGEHWDKELKKSAAVLAGAKA